MVNTPVGMTNAQVPRLKIDQVLQEAAADVAVIQRSEQCMTQMTASRDATLTQPETEHSAVAALARHGAAQGTVGSTRIP